MYIIHNNTIIYVLFAVYSYTHYTYVRVMRVTGSIACHNIILIFYHIVLGIFSSSDADRRAVMTSHRSPRYENTRTIMNLEQGLECILMFFLVNFFAYAL